MNPHFSSYFPPHIGNGNLDETIDASLQELKQDEVLLIMTA